MYIEPFCNYFPCPLKKETTVLHDIIIPECYLLTYCSRKRVLLHLYYVCKLELGVIYQSMNFELRTIIKLLHLIKTHQTWIN